MSKHEDWLSVAFFAVGIPARIHSQSASHCQRATPVCVWPAVLLTRLVAACTMGLMHSRSPASIAAQVSCSKHYTTHLQLLMQGVLNELMVQHTQLINYAMCVCIKRNIPHITWTKFDEMIHLWQSRTPKNELKVYDTFMFYISDCTTFTFIKRYSFHVLTNEISRLSYNSCGKKAEMDYRPQIQLNVINLSRWWRIVYAFLGYDKKTTCSFACR